MQDLGLYARIPRVREPWRAESVDLTLTEGEVKVHLRYDLRIERRCSELRNKTNCKVAVRLDRGGLNLVPAAHQIPECRPV